MLSLFLDPAMLAGIKFFWQRSSRTCAPKHGSW